VRQSPQYDNNGESAINVKGNHSVIGCAIRADDTEYDDATRNASWIFMVGYKRVPFLRGRRASTIRRAAKSWVGRLIEPQVLFPVTALLLLAVVWAMTYGMVRVSHSAAVSAAMASSSELVDTDEA
jgi:hypothetical protein